MKNLTLDYRNRLARYDLDENNGLSDEANFEFQFTDEILEHYFEPVSRKTLYIEFFELAEQWKNETKYYSSNTDICMHPAYQQIMGFGPRVLTFIFIDLKHELNHWFWALSMITGIDPVPHDKRGDLESMRTIWLDWAKKNSYL